MVPSKISVPARHGLESILFCRISAGHLLWTDVSLPPLPPSFPIGPPRFIQVCYHHEHGLPSIRHVLLCQETTLQPCRIWNPCLFDDVAHIHSSDCFWRDTLFTVLRWLGLRELGAPFLLYLLWKTQGTNRSIKEWRN